MDPLKLSNPIIFKNLKEVKDGGYLLIPQANGITAKIPIAKRIDKNTKGIPTAKAVYDLVKGIESDKLSSRLVTGGEEEGGSGESGGSVDWDDVQNKPSTFTPSTHNHDAAYADVDHNHSGVYATASHTHSGYSPANPTFVTKTTNYTLTSADNNKIILMNSSSNLTVYCPVLSAGFNCQIIKIGTGNVTIDVISTTRRSKDSKSVISSQYAAASVVYHTSSLFYLIGDLS